MSRRPTPLPPSLGRIFTAEQARAVGVTPRRLRAQDVEHPYRGLMVARSPEASPPSTPAEDLNAPLARDRAQRSDMRRRAEVYRPLMVSHAFFVGRTAAGFWELPVDCSGELEVGVTAPHRAPRRTGINGHQVTARLVSVREVDGFAVASPASTWAMLAADLSVRELVQVGDALVRIPRDEFARLRRDLALCSIEQLRAAANAGRRRGVKRLRDAIEEIRVGSASPLETDCRLGAASGGLPEPALDVEIRDARGRMLGVTEIAYPEFRVLVEVEGDHHRTSRSQWNRDIEKYAAYAAEGYEVVRLTSEHIRGERPRAAGIIREALMRHGWMP